MHGQGEGNNVIKDNFLFNTDAHAYTNETRTIFSANVSTKDKTQTWPKYHSSFAFILFRLMNVTLTHFS